MTTMTVVTDALSAVGAADTAITYMGPVLTIGCAWLGGIAVGQILKWPLAAILPAKVHGYIVRVCAVMTTFSFAHYLSNHLSVPMEVFVSVFQPTIYLGLKAAADKWAPWLSKTVFRSVGATP